MKRYGTFVVCALLAAFLVGLMHRESSSLTAVQQKDPEKKAQVYVYPEKLTPKDKLSFGNKEQETIPIKSETTLIYVDLAPDFRFAHPTQCILISTDGAQVIKGDWWLVLNGKPLFRDGKEYKVDFPVNLAEK